MPSFKPPAGGLTDAEMMVGETPPPKKGLTDAEIATPKAPLTDEQVLGAATAARSRVLTDADMAGSSLMDRAIEPLKRIIPITQSEAEAGADQFMRGIKGTADAQTGVVPGVVSRVADVALGGLQWVNSPITGLTRALAGEPTKNTLKGLGAPDWVAEGSGMAAELGLSAAIPSVAGRAVKEVKYAMRPKIPPLKRTPAELAAAELEKAKLSAPKAAMDKADEFLKTDLTKVEIPPIGSDRQVNYVNYLITSDDVKQAAVAAEQVRGSSKVAVPWSKTERLARESGITAKDLLSRSPNSAATATQLEAYKSVMAAAHENVTALASKVTTGVATDTEKALFYTQFDELMRMSDEFQGIKSEAGRALGILRKATSSDTAKLNAIRLATEGKVGELSVGELASMIQAADTPEKLASAIDKARKATTTQAFIEAWKAGLLTGLRTHEANFIGNTLTTLLQFPERTVAAGLGKLHAGDKVFMREVPAQLVGAYNGAIEGLESAAFTMRHGMTRESAEKAMDSAGTISAFKGSTFGLTGAAGKAVDIAGEGIRLPFRFLSASDEFFKTTAMRMELNALATRQALSEGHAGKDLAQRVTDLVHNPPAELMEKAADFGKYVTFNKELGVMGKAAMTFARSHPGWQIVVPFMRTPTNIIKFAGERTPLAIFSKAVRAEMAKGGAARDLAVAKIMTGTAISTWAAVEAMKGNITGGGPTEPAQRRNLMATGWKPYSFKVGDTFYQYNRFDPFATLIGTAADAVEIHKAATEDERAKIATMVAASLTKNLTDKSFVKGLSDLVKVMGDPERYGERIAEQLAGSVVPSMVADIATSKDPILRDARSMIDAIKARTPGLTGEILPRRDIFGKPIERHSGGIEAFSVVQPSEAVTDKAYTEMNRLKITTQLPDRKIGGKEMDPELYDQYQEMAGGIAKKGIDKLVNDPAYDSIPRVMKERLFKDILNTSREIARLRLGIETKKIQASVEQMTKDYTAGAQ